MTETEYQERKRALWLLWSPFDKALNKALASAAKDDVDVLDVWYDVYERLDAALDKEWAATPKVPRLQGPATSAQIAMIERLENEAFSRLYHGKATIGRDALRRIRTSRHGGKQEASEVIDALVKARARGWKD